MRSGRVFGLILLVAALSGTVLALALAITLFPGALQVAAHGSGLLQTCAAAIYELGRMLPPLGAGVLLVTLFTVAFGGVRAARILERTARLLRTCGTSVRPPSRLLRAADRSGLTGRVVCVEGPLRLAYTAGLLQPRVYISTAALGALDDDGLAAVLAHEHHHLERRDPLRALVVRVLSTALFPFPLVAALAERFEVAAELDADLAAIGTCGTPALAGALATLGSAPSEVSLAAVGAWSLSSARVDQLCGDDPMRPLPSMHRAIALTVLALLFGVMLAAGQAARANLLPASLLDPLRPGATLEVHTCPVPLDGILL
ncbi:MAG: M56 family metallopeptidase [Thermoleophilaceae bacterium]